MSRERPARKQSMFSPLRRRISGSGSSSSRNRNRSLLLPSLLWLRCCCFLVIHSLQRHNGSSSSSGMVVQFEVSAFVVVDTTTTTTTTTAGAKNTIFAKDQSQQQNRNNRNTKNFAIAETTTTRSRAFATTTTRTTTRTTTPGQASRQASLREAVPTELGETETTPAKATSVNTEAAPFSGSPRMMHDHEYVWMWEEKEKEENNRDDDEQSWNLGGSWRRPEVSSDSSVVSSLSAEKVTTLVRNWCEDFVLALDLCPWAKSSIQTRGAMRFFLVPPLSKSDDAPSSSMRQQQQQDEQEHDELRMCAIVDDVAGRFQAEILDPATAAGSPEEDDDKDASPSKVSVMEKAAIYFVVFLSPETMVSTMPSTTPSASASTTPSTSTSTSPMSLASQSPSLPDAYADFINWFMDLEDNWPEDFDDVIIAPFHPSWEFGSESTSDPTTNNTNNTNNNNDDDDDDEACLDYEKRSPFPLVTLVSTRVVEKAGMATTEAIGERNREILLGIEQQQQAQRKTITRGPEGTERRTATTTRQRKKSHKNASVAELWRSAVYGRNDTKTAS